MTFKKIGMVTIGQSPRVDIVPQMMEILGLDLEIMEAGALDGLSFEEVKEFSPRKGDLGLCSRMADGAGVVIAKKFILSRVQNCINLLEEKGAEIIVLLGTEKFPKFSSKRLVIEPHKILDCCIRVFQRKQEKIGLIIPHPSQLDQSKKKYSRMKNQVVIQVASPYALKDEISPAAEELKKAAPHMIVMHGMGYTQAMKRRVTAVTGKPVILPCSLVARIMKELVS